VDTLSLLAELARGEEADRAAAEASALASSLPSPDTRARALAARGRADLDAGEADRAAPSFRRAAGLLLSSGRPSPLLAATLLDSSRALAGSDPAAAAAASRRAEEVLAELRARGFSDEPGTGFPAAAAAPR
jgi:hypothetical protein